MFWFFAAFTYRVKFCALRERNPGSILLTRRNPPEYFLQWLCDDLSWSQTSLHLSPVLILCTRRVSSAYKMWSRQKKCFKNHLWTKHLQCTPKRATRYNCCLEMRFSFLLFWHAWAKKSNTTGDNQRRIWLSHYVISTQNWHLFRFIFWIFLLWLTKISYLTTDINPNPLRLLQIFVAPYFLPTV